MPANPSKCCTIDLCGCYDIPTTLEAEIDTPCCEYTAVTMPVAYDADSEKFVGEKSLCGHTWRIEAYCVGMGNWALMLFCDGTPTSEFPYSAGASCLPLQAAGVATTADCGCVGGAVNITIREPYRMPHSLVCELNRMWIREMGVGH